MLQLLGHYLGLYTQNSLHIHKLINNGNLPMRMTEQFPIILQTAFGVNFSISGSTGDILKKKYLVHSGMKLAYLLYKENKWDGEE